MSPPGDPTREDRNHRVWGCCVRRSLPRRQVNARPIPHPPFREAGLTLIEVMVVMLVLGILAALVAPDVFSHVSTARQESARAQIEMLNAALDAYRLHNGRYPTTDQGLEALRTEPRSSPVPADWRGPYLRKDVPDDPWGRPYVYRSPGTESGWGYDLLSLGADGEPGGEGEDADVKAWD